MQLGKADTHNLYYSFFKTLLFSDLISTTVDFLSPLFDLSWLLLNKETLKVLHDIFSVLSAFQVKMVYTRFNFYTFDFISIYSKHI